ncbi:MAG: GAF domain-containing protein [Cyclobacteriaceae bacterium]
MNKINSHDDSKRKIIRKFLLIFCLILTCIISSYCIVFWFNLKQKTQGTQIDIVGRNRMLSQRIGAMALLLDTDVVAHYSIAKDEMKKAISLLDQTLKVLKNGGLVSGTNDPIEIPPASPLMAQKIIEVQELFATLTQTTNLLSNEPRILDEVGTTDSVSTNLLNPKFREGIAKLREQLVNGTLLKANIELTKLYVQQAEDAKRYFFTLLAILLLVNVAVIGLAYFSLSKALQPLKSITSRITLLSDGELPPPMKVETDDEVGEITAAFNKLAHNLELATEFAKNVGDGKFDTTVRVFNDKGDLSQSLYSMRDNLRKVAEEDKKSNWANEGYAKLTDLLTVDSNLQTIGDKLISFIVNYTGSNQGSLFILNDQHTKEPYLELLACYAYNRKKFVTKKIYAGEGIVGQSLLERETVFMRDIPNNYVTITSGLGETTPRSLLIVPMKINKEIAGIIEIASFKEYLPDEISFVEKLAENSASAIVKMKATEQMRQLLELSQQQMEELKTQEEEMNQSMEELSATQESMSRKEEEYLNKISSLESELRDLRYSRNLSLN